ncbi:MAG: phosphonate ABC transporter, permease protein PhnE [Oscillospiraceae bacterium]|nr:phosphonate ABC transporter, permease protein PhnE [Oscillospiraceae bacterium]
MAEKLEKIEQVIDEKLTAAEMYARRPRKWWLYTLIVLILAVVISWSGSSLSYTGMTSTGTQVAKGVVNGITHPDMQLLFGTGDTDVPYLLLQTIAIAVLGTLFGAILAIPFAFLASTNILPKPIAYLFRVVILLIRTIPSLVWALMWIRVTGPGAACGVITQSVCSIGMISKMYITAIEDLDTRILESLDAMGCTPFQKIRYGVIPQLTASFISTTIYRFDINLKDATTLGIVGAGGIGASLVQCLNSRRWAMVGSFVWGLMVLVLIIEFASTRVRKKLARGE